MHTHLHADQYYNRRTILSSLKLLLDPPHNKKHPMSSRFWRQDSSQNVPALYSLYMDQTMVSINHWDDRGGAAPEEEEGGKGGRPGTTTTTTGVPEYVLTDEFSREAYDRIMRQYTEARHYARAAGGRTNPVVRRQARSKAETTVSTGTTTMSAAALEAASRSTRSSTRTTTRSVTTARSRTSGGAYRPGGGEDVGRTGGSMVAAA